MHGARVALLAAIANALRKMHSYVLHPAARKPPNSWLRWYWCDAEPQVLHTAMLIHAAPSQFHTCGLCELQISAHTPQVHQAASQGKQTLVHQGPPEIDDQNVPKQVEPLGRTQIHLQREACQGEAQHTVCVHCQTAASTCPAAPAHSLPLVKRLETAAAQHTPHGHQSRDMRDLRLYAVMWATY
jgi:hypothetical protein